MKRSEFLSVLAKHGATLDTECEDYDLNIDAPKGKVFSASGRHCLCEPFNNSGGQSWKPQAYAMAAARVGLGKHDCPDPECDVCHGDGE